ncbi:MAG: YqgE/AlgH family protein [Muribaculaceae bacterium]|nr:YqgE/AlgH family protein [Muribaculaceae bacterium]
MKNTLKMNIDENSLRGNSLRDIDIESLIYKDPQGLNPQKGDLLIAEPLLDQPYFKRSVILLLEEDKDHGHVGLTLNVPTPVTLQDLFPQWQAGKRVRIYSGGPVESDRLFMLHTLGDHFEGASEVAPGLYVGANLDQVMDYINNEESIEGKLRFFLGYSGWSKDQLNVEIMNHSWALAHPERMRDALLGNGNDYWRREVEKLGKEFRSWLIIPQDPEEN